MKPVETAVAATPDLVAIDDKRHFAEDFLPRYQKKATDLLFGRSTEEEVNAWIDERLKPYGSDARLLVEKAFRSFVKQARENKSVDSAALTFMDRMF